MRSIVPIRLTNYITLFFSFVTYIMRRCATGSHHNGRRILIIIGSETIALVDNNYVACSVVDARHQSTAIPPQVIVMCAYMTLRRRNNEVGLGKAHFIDK